MVAVYFVAYAALHFKPCADTPATGTWPLARRPDAAPRTSTSGS